MTWWPQGVAGIGPKTAAQLLASYGSLAGIHAAAGELSPKRRASLQVGARPGTAPPASHLLPGGLTHPPPSTQPNLLDLRPPFQKAFPIVSNRFYTYPPNTALPPLLSV